MVHNDEPYNGCNADIDEITKRKMKAGFKIFNDQGYKFEIQEKVKYAFQQLDRRGSVRVENNLVNGKGLFYKKDGEDESQQS